MAARQVDRVQGAPRISSRSLKRPSLKLAVGFNRAVLESDEWFDEPDDLDRVERALESIISVKSPLRAAAVLAYRVTRAQAFAEGNKRTALLLARWLLDKNGQDGAQIVPSSDRHVADLLVQAAAGIDVEEQLVALFEARASTRS